MSKVDEYGRLVKERKACRLCHGLRNPADVDAGRFDVERIGVWSVWQGNLEARLMVVGQDWGDVTYFRRHEGGEGPRNPTNLALVKLTAEAGVSIGHPGTPLGRNVAFFTNAILCLKDGGLQGKVHRTWFSNCGSFLRRQIEIVRPLVVVGLGERAYRSILGGFGLTVRAFRTEVQSSDGTLLPNGSRAFAVYHCGARIRNTHRSMAEQISDWQRIRPFLDQAKRVPERTIPTSVLVRADDVIEK